MNVFGEMGKYWAEIADQNQTDRQILFIKNTLKPEGFMLDFACGTGRHLIPLSKEGYSAVGLDISANLLRIAKSRWRNAQLVRADMRFLPFKPETFSAAVSMDTSFGYLPTEQDDLQSLKALHDALIKGGLLIVDVFNRERLILKYKSSRLKELRWAFLPVLLKPNRLAKWLLFRFFKWKEYPSFFLFQKREITANGERLNDLWVVCDKGDGEIRVFEHIARLYEFKRLEGLLENTGFTVNAVYGDYGGQSFSRNSSRLILVASAK